MSVFNASGITHVNLIRQGINIIIIYNTYYAKWKFIDIYLTVVIFEYRL